MAEAESDVTAMQAQERHAYSRAKGHIRYTDDVAFSPDSLFGAIVRSDIGHGHILGIHTTDAESASDVVAVLTIEDIRDLTSDLYYGAGYRDQPILADKRVRHFGEPVAVVLAHSQHAARRAARLVVVDYERLPVVVDDLDAVLSTVPIHDAATVASDFEDLKLIQQTNDANVYLRYRLRTGDFDEAAASAAYVFEHRFSTPSACATPLETISTYAIPTPTGIEVHSQTQMPSYVRKQLSRIFGLPESRIRVVQAPLGGGFGLKIYIRLEALATACALLVDAPVVLKMTMEEQFYFPNTRSTTTTIASAVAPNGRVVARRASIIWNGGAYADIGPRMIQKSGLVAAGPYKIPVVDIESLGVYSNRVPGGAIRGFGVPQVVWAHELHTSMIAAELGLSEVEFRRRNLMGKNAVHQSGTVVRDCDPSAVFERLIADMGSPLRSSARPDRELYGRGVSIGLKAVLTPSTSVAMVTLAPDGSATVHSGTVEMGQGAGVAMAQMVATELKIPVSSVRVVSGDTDSVPWDMGTMGSRSTYHMAKAISFAIEDIRSQLSEMLALKGIGSKVDPLLMEGGLSSIIRSHFGAMGATVTGVGSFTPDYQKPDAAGRSDQVTEFWMCAATGVDIVVDPGTGVVKLRRLMSVADAGRVINPAMVRTQLSGAAIMQASMSIAEEVLYDDDGQLLNPGMAFYRVFGFGDSPGSVVSTCVEYPEDAVPKGVGESGTFGVGPAVAAAIHDALGVWVTAQPFTPERVLRAQEEKARG